MTSDPTSIRNGQVGDYYLVNGVLYVRVYTGMDNPNAVYGTAIHEIVEALLLINKGTPLEAVDQYDAYYYKHGRCPRCNAIKSEPGDDEHAPYHTEHQAATMIEELFTTLLNEEKSNKPNRA